MLKLNVALVLFLQLTLGLFLNSWASAADWQQLALFQEVVGCKAALEPASTSKSPANLDEKQLKKIHILVEGAGDVVERFYIPALQKQIEKYRGEKEITVTFTDRSIGENAIRKEKRLRIKEKVLTIGADYIDKSTPEGAKAYEEVQPDYVVIALPASIHAKSTNDWLVRKKQPIRIFTEKPVDSALEPVQVVMEKLEAFDPRVMALDHYRPASGLNPATVNEIEQFIGGSIDEFKFYLLEDRSSADPTLQSANKRDGAIEGEDRVAVLREGVAIDLLSHMLALVEYFGPVATTRPVRVWAGRYMGVDGNPNKPTEIPSETFFATQFVFLDRHGNKVEGEAAVGKGIRGVKALGPEYERNAKLLEVGRKSTGRKVRVDLRRFGKNSAQITFMDADGTILRTQKLRGKPYDDFFEGIIKGTSAENGHSMYYEPGRDALVKLKEFIHPIQAQSMMAVYPGGMAGVRESPFMEDLKKTLPQLSGPGSRTVSLADLYPNIQVDRDFLMVGGAGVMGKGFTKRLASAAGLKVVVADPNPKAKEILAGLGEGLDILLKPNLAEAVASLVKPRKIMLLVPNEAILDSVLKDLEPMLEAGDVVIDGGNSMWSKTEARQVQFKKRGIELIGMGVSGGERGALNGSSMMPGGSREGYAKIQKIVEAIAASVPSDNPASTETSPSVAYIGPGGAGHYVKMAHNGIEYAEMQMLAESYDVLTRLLGYSADEVRNVFGGWNKTEVGSFLLQAAEKVLGRVDAKTQQPLVDLILDQAKQKGTGKWTAQSVLDLGVYAPTLDAAVLARFGSALKKERVALERVLPGPKVVAKKLTLKQEARLLQELPAALFAAKLLVYSQGLSLITMASKEQFNGEINLVDVTRIWRNGSILQSNLLDSIHDVLLKNPKSTDILFDTWAQQQLEKSQKALRYVVGVATQQGIPMAAFSSALSYYDSLRSGRLPANLLQALRDYFGGHQYERIDEPGVNHHDTWGD